MDNIVLTPVELTLAKEAVFPTICKMTDLLLRGGAVGYLDFERQLREKCEMGNCGPTNTRRINPVTFKQVVTECGVMLTPSEFKAIRRAYSDEGGLLVDTVLELVRPLERLSESQAKVLYAMCADVLDDSGETSTVLLDDLIDIFEGIFASEESSSPVFGNISLETRIVFTPSRYPKGRVPPQDVMNFLSAILLNYSEVEAPLLERLRAVQLRSAPAERAPHAAPALPSNSSTCVRRQRLFDYYTDRDNRDEWIRGRDENDARTMYLRHVPGYQGHMPTFRSKFGRTFHAIEESMPVLSKPKPQRDPVPVDRYGPGVELRDNRMSRHHFRLS